MRKLGRLPFYGLFVKWGLHIEIFVNCLAILVSIRCKEICTYFFPGALLHFKSLFLWYFLQTVIKTWKNLTCKIDCHTLICVICFSLFLYLNGTTLLYSGWLKEVKNFVSLARKMISLSGKRFWAFAHQDFGWKVKAILLFFMSVQWTRLI